MIFLIPWHELCITSPNSSTLYSCVHPTMDELVCECWIINLMYKMVKLHVCSLIGQNPEDKNRLMEETKKTLIRKVNTLDVIFGISSQQHKKKLNYNLCFLS